MKARLLFLAVLVLLTFTSCSDNGGNSLLSANKEKTPEELRQELKKKEELDFQTYIKLQNVTFEPNKIREEGWFSNAQYDGYLAQGQIKNTASVAKFKDVVLTVYIYSKTKTIIDQKDYVIYEYLEPNGILPFKLKVNPPDAMSSYHIEVKGVTPI